MAQRGRTGVGMGIEWGMIGAIRWLHEIVRPVFAKRKGWRAKDGAKVIEARKKWKPIIDERLAEVWRNKLGSDVTVRDVRRLSEYPESKDGGKRPSAWFRAGLVGTNQGHALLLRGWISLDREVIDFLQLDHFADEAARMDGAAALIGYVPFEQIEDVDWTGDDYSSRSTLYLHFDAAEGPYSRVVICRQRTEQIGQQQHEWYSEIVDREKYRDAVSKLGITDNNFTSYAE